MHDHDSWSLSFGRWGGIQVRLHAFFLLFAVFTFYQSRLADDVASGSSGVDWITVLSLGILLVSLVVHELGHLWLAVRQGGYVEQIVICPFGGLEPVRGIEDPKGEVVANAGGPLANAVVCAICAPVLLHMSGDVVGVLHPLAPVGLTVGSTALVVVKLTFWINWLLVLINLLPAFPFDGGRVLQSLLLWYWPAMGRQASSLIVSSVAKLGAVVVMLLALVLEFEDAEGLVPTRFLLILLAILLFFAAKRQERREKDRLDRGRDGYGLLDEFDEFERYDGEAGSELADRTGPLQTWLEQRRQQRLRRRQQVEAEEERRVDEILARLHECGMESLSPEDRALLDRVSARYRSRLRHGPRPTG